MWSNFSKFTRQTRNCRKLVNFVALARVLCFFLFYELTPFLVGNMGLVGLWEKLYDRCCCFQFSLFNADGDCSSMERTGPLNTKIQNLFHTYPLLHHSRTSRLKITSRCFYKAKHYIFRAWSPRAWINLCDVTTSLVFSKLSLV